MKQWHAQDNKVQYYHKDTATTVETVADATKLSNEWVSSILTLLTLKTNAFFSSVHQQLKLICRNLVFWNGRKWKWCFLRIQFLLFFLSLSLSLCLSVSLSLPPSVCTLSLSLCLSFFSFFSFSVSLFLTLTLTLPLSLPPTLVLFFLTFVGHQSETWYVHHMCFNNKHSNSTSQ